MPKLKQTFIQGKMNKDLDERLLPNGQYRDALNIQISTSEGSDVGAIENVLGNAKVNKKSSGPDVYWDAGFSLLNATAIGVVADSQNNKLYWFLTSDTVDAILEYDKEADIIAPVLVDTNGVLNFSKANIITGVNVFEGLIAWTDNRNEPRIINIETFKAGSVQTGTRLDTHTTVFGRDFIASDINVIKLKPKTAPEFTAASSTRTGIGVGLSVVTTVQNFTENVDGANAPVQVNSTGTITIIEGAPNWQIDDIIALTATRKNDDNYNDVYEVRIKVTGGVGTASIDYTVVSIGAEVTYGHYTWDCVLEEAEPMFELGFPRFAYRWKYTENKYSGFSPWTEPVFVPGKFKYTSSEAFNEGMVNNLRLLTLDNWETPPADVVGIDILYKDSATPAVYRVAELDASETSFSITSELIYDIIDSNQALRAYDNVPRKALAQEVIGNRLVYANYLQNYNVSNDAEITLAITSNDITEVKTPEASVKSMRTYQVGIVYLDENGRETPVFTNATSTLRLDKTFAPKVNEITATSAQSAPSWATHFKYYVKDISNEYYNLALDRYYDSKDGNLWLSFPSAERNKVSEDSYIILKKEHDNDRAITRKAKYKILDISNEAPDAIRVKKQHSASHTGIVIGEQTTTFERIEAGKNKFNFWGNDNGGASLDFHTALNQGRTYVRFQVDTNVTKFYEVESGGFVGEVDDVSGLYKYEVTLKYPIEEALFSPLLDDDTFKVEVWEMKSQNLEEFEGKFFVKVPRDTAIENAILYAFSLNEIDYYEDGVASNITYSTTNDPFSSQGQTSANYAWSGVAANPPTIPVAETYAEVFAPMAGSKKFGLGYFEYNSSNIPSHLQDLQNNLVDECVIQVQDYLGDWGQPLKVESVVQGVITRIYGTEEIYYFTVTLEEPLGPTYGFGGGNVPAAVRVMKRNRDTPIIFDENSIALSSSNPAIFETEPREAVDLDIYYEATDAIAISEINNTQTLSFHNCYSFGNGVESDRVRDDFNAKTIGKGVKASSIIDEPYTEDRRKSGLIWSGLFNSMSSFNELNQFNQAVKITKDLNPVHGSIQKLYARDTDLTALCEDKVFRILANKDALYNADGNVNVTASNNVLGQAVPYAGEYGISKNPETFAAFGFRAYFTDKERGAVLRLSRDGMTEISSKGMERYFGEKLNGSIVALDGSYDTRTNSYNLSFFNDETISFKENVDGWVTRLSFTPEAAISLNQVYYTFKDGEMWAHNNTARSNFYGVQEESNVKMIINEQPSLIKNFKSVSYEGDAGWEAEFTTNEEAGYIDTWVKREGIHHNYIAGKKAVWDNATHTGTLDTTRFSVQGIGGLASSALLGSDFELTFSGHVNVSVSINDPVFFVRSGQIFHLGSITSIAGERVVATNDHGLSIPVAGEFVFVAKDNEKNTSGIRGYYAEAVFKTTSSDKKELFAVNPNVFISSE